jgi:hypothetical protein
MLKGDMVNFVTYERNRAAANQSVVYVASAIKWRTQSSSGKMPT